MTEYKMTLSTTEPNNYVGLIKLRQGDINTQEIEATITANSQLFKFDRLSVFFNAVLPNGNVIRDKVTGVDYVNSKLNYVVADSFLQEVAQVTAWFSFENDEKIIDSTKNFQYSVIAGWKECIPQGNYIYELSEIQREIEEIISNKDFTSLISKISSLETDVKYLDARIDGLDAKDADLQNQINTNKTSITNTGSRIDDLENETTAQLADKVGGGVKAEPEDLSATTLGLVTGTGGPINLLSVPQDSSVTPTKTTFYNKTGNLFNVLNPNTNLLPGALTIDSTENVSIIKLDGKPTALGATTVSLMTGAGNYIAFDTSAQYTLTAKLLSGTCFDTRAVSLVVRRTDTGAALASINAGKLLSNGGELSVTFTPTFVYGKVDLIFSAGAYDINDCEILINITKSANSSVEPFGYRLSQSVDYYEQNKKLKL